MKLIATDEAFPDWTPRLQGVIEEAVAILQRVIPRA